jgi:DNA polymerase-1
MTSYEEVLRLPDHLDEKRVLVIDGHSLAYRSYYAIRDLTTQSGQPVNAVYGFWRVLIRTLRDYPSAYVAVVFDAGGTTFRHELYSAYKATRKPIPDDLESQLPLIEQLLDALGVPVISESGVEADDVIATVARRAASLGLRCLILTSDKDMAQLVTDRITLLRPGGRRETAGPQLLDPKGVENKYGVPPNRIVDLFALVGDSSDNVPGVPGVGEKSAARLVREFESLDAILASADSVRNARIRQNLKAHERDARFARQLIVLRSDLPLEDVLKLCRLRGIDPDELARCFAKLEFASALSELNLDARPSLEPARKNHRAGEYHAVLDEAALDELVQALGESNALSVDLETTSLAPMKAEIVGIAVSPSPYLGYYIPVAHDGLGVLQQLPLERVLDTLRPLIEGEHPKILGQNLKYDLVILARHGLRPSGIAFDTMIASHLVRPEERRHNLEQIANSFLGYQMTTYAEVAGKNGPFAAVPLASATQYAAEDAEIVQRLRPLLTRKMEEINVLRLFEEVEVPLLPVLARMERNGVLLDCAVLGEHGEEIREELRVLEADLEAIAGEPFNPSSPKQVAEILFDRLGLPVAERTKTGPSTNARVLAELAVHHPLPGKLMAYRELKKLLTTYIDQLPEAVHPETGRIHTTFHQTSTATGRLSSSEPNMQNIPTRTEIGGRIRQAFIAPEGSVLVSSDYSQIELRLLAHFSEDEALIETFRTGADLHRLTASYVFGVPESEVTQPQRDAAKRINFGILYGISPYGLARDLGITQANAKAYIEGFFSSYPKAKAHIEHLVDTASRRGYAETILGRRRPLRDLGSRNIARRNFDRRNAVNTPIQGSAADLIKLAMIRIDRLIEEQGLRALMLLQIHDELVFEVEENAYPTVAPLIAEAMENVLPLNVPLEVKLTVGKNWGEI